MSRERPRNARKKALLEFAAIGQINTYGPSSMQQIISGGKQPNGKMYKDSRMAVGHANQGKGWLLSNPNFKFLNGKFDLSNQAKRQLDLGQDLLEDARKTWTGANGYGEE